MDKKNQETGQPGKDAHPYKDKNYRPYNRAEKPLYQPGNDKFAEI
ncbi:hypothetical protein [Taibaiella chishuiensis]|nr:hypothetical protein [Taibaiella chishuiensis]